MPAKTKTKIRSFVPRYSDEVYGAMAQEMYDTKVRPLLKASDKGRFVTLDIETGEFEIGDDDRDTVRRLWERLPDPQPFTFCVGYKAAVKIGGRLSPDPKWKLNDHRPPPK
ncbi:hypothetical protein BH11PLA2_BH11PLA2_46600 [soil metagenome]